MQITLTPLQAAILKRLLFNADTKKMTKWIQQNHAAASEKEVADAMSELLIAVAKPN